MIDEITLTNFKAFASLELEKLKRVNLIVGENNAGKTSLLEAIYLLCNPQEAGKLHGLFRAPQGDPNSRYYRWLLRDDAGGDQCSLRWAGDQAETIVELTKSSSPMTQRSSAEGHPLQPIQTSFTNVVWVWPIKRGAVLSCRTVSVRQREPSDLVGLVGKAQKKKNGEETLEALLAKVDPRITKVRLDPGLDSEEGNQVIIDIGLSELVPVSQIGEGVYRLSRSWRI